MMDTGEYPTGHQAARSCYIVMVPRALAQLPGVHISVALLEVL